MRKTVKRILVGFTSGMVSIAALTTAPAAVAGNPDQPVTKPAKVIAGDKSSSGVSPALACREEVWFHYYGWKKCGTDQYVCDFDGGDYDESWVVAEDRTIWHAWPGSGRWREMPNSGRADNIYDCYLSGNGHRVVEVWVNGSGRWWSWRDGSGVWHGWYRA